MRLGEVLLEMGLLTPEQLERALQMQVAAGGRLGTVLIELRLVGIDDVGRALGQQHGVPAATQQELEEPEAEALSAVPVELVKRHALLPLRREGKRLVAAMRDPHDIAAIDEISFVAGRVDPRAAAELRVFYYLERHYRIPRLARYVRVPDSAMQSHGGDERRRYLQPSAGLLDPEQAEAGFYQASYAEELAGQAAAGDGLDLTPLAGDPRDRPGPAEAAAAPGPAAAVGDAGAGDELSLVYLDEFDVDVAVDLPDGDPGGEPSPPSPQPMFEGVPRPRRAQVSTAESLLAGAADEGDQPVAGQRDEDRQQGEDEDEEGTVGTSRVHCANCSHVYDATPPLIWTICPRCGHTDEDEEWSLPAAQPAGARDEFDEARETALLANPTLEEACAQIAEAGDREAVLRGLVGPALSVCPVSVLFSVRQQLAVGVAARGSLTSAIELQALVVPLTTPSLLQRCFGERAVLRGSFVDDPILAMVAGYLRGVAVGEALVAPLILGGRIFNLLCCGSRPGTAFSERAELELELLVGAAEARLGALARSR